MAANYCKGKAMAGSLAKRVTNQILASNSQSSTFTRRVTHYSSSSSYDKNVDEHVRPAVVPDHMIASDSDKYWGPHPKTGVFGPAWSGTHGDAAAGDGPSPSPSVMDQTAWFRPLEDVDKPPPSSLA